MHKSHRNRSPETGIHRLGYVIPAMPVMLAISGGPFLQTAGAQQIASPEQKTVLNTCSLGLKGFQPQDVRLGERDQTQVIVKYNTGGPLAVRKYARVKRTIFPEVSTRYIIDDTSWRGTVTGSQLEYIAVRSFMVWWDKGVIPDANDEVKCLPAPTNPKYTNSPSLDRDHRFNIVAPPVSVGCKLSQTSFAYVGYLSFLEIKVKEPPGVQLTPSQKRPFRFSPDYFSEPTNCIPNPNATQRLRLLPKSLR